MFWYLLRVTCLLLWNSFVGRRADPEQPFVVRTRAWPWHCDAYFHLNNAAYLRLAEDARWAWTARTPLFRRALRGRWSFIVGGVDLIYRREVPLMSSFDNARRILGGHDRWMYFSQAFHLPDGTIACRALVRALVRSPQGLVSPQEVASVVGVQLPGPGPDVEQMKALAKVQLAALQTVPLPHSTTPSGKP